MTSPSRAIESAFGPIVGEPIVVDTTVGTTPAALVADISDDMHHRDRRVFIYNSHASQTIAVLLKPRGIAWASSGLDHQDGLAVPPGQFRQLVVNSRLSIGVVGSSATTSFNAVVSDT